MMVGMVGLVGCSQAIILKMSDLATDIREELA
jgi:hypothetical protein